MATRVAVVRKFQSRSQKLAVVEAGISRPGQPPSPERRAGRLKPPLPCRAAGFSNRLRHRGSGVRRQKDGPIRVQGACRQNVVHESPRDGLPQADRAEKCCELLAMSMFQGRPVPCEARCIRRFRRCEPRRESRFAAGSFRRINRFATRLTSGPSCIAWTRDRDARGYSR